MDGQRKKLRFAVLGCGFWSRFQIAAWKELEGVELVAVYNRTLSRATETARTFNVPHYYDNVEALLENEELDFIDIITDVSTHYQFVNMALDKRIPVICQKPMTANLKEAQELVSKSKALGVPFFVHENFRWQAPLRRLKEVMDSGIIGGVFKARISFCSAFPVFENQPFLAEAEQFILADIGSHVLDEIRFLLGEAKVLFCRTKTVNRKIKGEDVANVFLEMQSGVHCYAEMSYASIMENEVFPQTLALIEGEEGSVELAPDFIIKTTTKQGTVRETVNPLMYPWADPDYAVVHSSIVEINRNFRDVLLAGRDAETAAADNLKTLELVSAAYDSARTGRVIHF